MSTWSRFAISLSLLASVILAAPASFAQVPPPVPALPDTERRTSYSISASTCACAVNFAVYGDSTDVDEWVQVWINGTRYLSITPNFTWSLSSISGQLATISRPITDAILTFSVPQTGTVQIVGARRPRRISQFSETAGVGARDLNQIITDIIAQNREFWDRQTRTLQAPPGETLNVLPPAASRASQGMCFDSLGNVAPCVSIPSSTFAAGTGIIFTGINPTTISATPVISPPGLFGVLAPAFGASF